MGKKENMGVYFFLLSSLFLKTSATDDNDIFKFPKDFLIGVASSAIQIEGAWNYSGNVN